MTHQTFTNLMASKRDQKTHQEKVSFVCNHFFTSEHSQAWMEALLEGFTMSHLTFKSQLFIEGNNSSKVYLIKEGTIKTVKQSASQNLPASLFRKDQQIEHLIRKVIPPSQIKVLVRHVGAGSILGLENYSSKIDAKAKYEYSAAVVSDKATVLSIDMDVS